MSALHQEYVSEWLSAQSLMEKLSVNINWRATAAGDMEDDFADSLINMKFSANALYPLELGEVIERVNV